MYVNLAGSTTHVCDTALAALYNVSNSLIGSVRAALDAMCKGLPANLGEEDEIDPAFCPSAKRTALLREGTGRYNYSRDHPIRRYSNEVRGMVERHLSMVIRADPAGSNGESACRVYDPEINTYQRLRDVLKRSLSLEDFESELSDSTIQRMIKAYLRKNKFSQILFTQSDHNACPNCKSMTYAFLQYEQEDKIAKRDVVSLQSQQRPFEKAVMDRILYLQDVMETKKFQQKELRANWTEHNNRDKEIRSFLSALSEYFMQIESSHCSLGAKERSAVPYSWRMRSGWAMMSHQDDMTKVDLPHFVVEASADITRWRFDVNAHVNLVNNDAVVFSHEQGMGSKDASLIVEEVLLHHLISCRGESIKVIVSDNAAVGKNWVTTVALPQYVVDQGLAEIVLVVFLENNHGKFSADMLFGQFQTRRRRSVMLGIDDMLEGFEGIQRTNGSVRAFALNPLSSINFCDVFDSLGYETKPPPKFNFVERNIHFAGACLKGAKDKLPAKLAELIGELLPDDSGMVRLSSRPPDGKSQAEKVYEDRYFDVPAARVSISGDKVVARHRALDPNEAQRGESGEPPLVVDANKPFSEGGYAVVSYKTATKLGYNGIEFSRQEACPEMSRSNLFQRAWPKGLLQYYGIGNVDVPYDESEGRKCAPLNWIPRKPVGHFGSDFDEVARYPPRNLLNAKCRQGPRVETPWIPTSTYDEEPFPIVPETAACSAMEKLRASHSDPRKSLHTLELLYVVYREIGDRGRATDPWLQNYVTVPKQYALAEYKKEMAVFVAREKGYPKAPISVKQAFKEDPEVAEKIAARLQEMQPAQQHGRSKRKRLEEKIVNELFCEAENQPCGLDKFRRAAALDRDRFSRELLEFRRTTQKDFDTRNGLLPQTRTQVATGFID